MTSELSASRGGPGKTFAHNAPSDRSAVVVVSSGFPRKTKIISKIEDCVGEVQVAEIRSYSAGQHDFLQLLLDAATWTNLLKVVATVCFSRLAHHIADDLWALKKKILSGLRDAPENPISRLAQILSDVKRRDDSVEIRLGLPLPDRHYGTVFRVETSAGNEIAQIIVELAAASPAIQEAVEGLLQKGEGPPLTGIQLSMSSEGHFTALWHGGSGRRSLIIRQPSRAEKEDQP